jgi:hypothetical protein
MHSIHILTAAGISLAVLASTGCQGGVVAPGSTAGNTWGGAYSARFAKKEETKPEPKKESKVKTYPPGAPGPYDRTGLITRVKDDRLWIFRDRTKDLAEFDRGLEPVKSATVVGEGPNGMSLRAPEQETIDSWKYTVPGFEVWARDGRLWVAKPQSLDWLWLRTGGELGKNVTLIGEGPDGLTIRAGDMATAEAYAAAAKG